MPDVNDWNRQIIEEFHANNGKVGGPFEGAPLLLLHSTGAKSRKERINPLAYMPEGEHYVIFASKAGAPTNPDWYHNLVAHPQTTIEVGNEMIDVVARVAGEAERAELYARQVQKNPGFGDYEKKTTRKIPVVILERQ